jgi:uncharacterized protein (TIGR02996 family)
MVLALKMADAPARPELLGLLRAAREDPADVSRRLVLADWLEDNGDEADSARAELIRLQCRLEPQPLFPAPPGPFVVPARSAGQAALLRRQDQLLTRYGRTWLGPLAELALSWDFRRGMAQLDLDARTLQSHRAAQVAGSEKWAWVEGVRLHGLTNRHLAQLSGCPPLAGVTAVTLTTDVRRSDMRTLVRTSWFAGLGELDLGRACVSDRALAVLGGSTRPLALERLGLCRSHLTSQAARELAHSRLLGGLTVLDLRHNRLGDSAIEALLGGARPGRLTHLLLAGNCVGPRGVRALARGLGRARLSHLDLGRNPLGPEGTAVLATAPLLAGLIHLDLGLCQLATEGVRALLCSPHLDRLEHLFLDHNEINEVSFLWQSPLGSGLRELDLSGNPLGDVGLLDLAGTPAPRQLQRLSLGNCEATGQSITALAPSAWLSNLTALDLSGNQPGMEGVRALGRSAALAGLGSLGLEGCGLDSAGAAALAGADHLGRLACLHLAGNHIEPDGVKALAGAAGLSGLVGLDLDDNPVDDEAALALVESPELAQLSMLSLWGCNVSDAGLAALARSPGLARISRLALTGPDIGAAGVRALFESRHAGSLRVLLVKTAPGLPPRQALERRLPGCLVSWTSE